MQVFRELASFHPPDRVIQARLLLDGRHVLYEVGGQNRGLWLGDIADPNNPRNLKGHDTKWLHLALASNGRLAVTARDDNTLWSWDLATEQSRLLRTRERAVLTSLAFSPDDRRVVYGCGGTIQFCDVATGDKDNANRKLREQVGPAIGRVAFCPDGRRIVAAHADRAIRVWDVKTGRAIWRMDHPADVTDFAIFPDGHRALTANCDGTVRVWDMDSGQEFQRIVGYFNDNGGKVAVSPDGRRALFGASEKARLWDLETGEVISETDGLKGVSCVGFSPDGLRAVAGATDKTVRVWALPPGRRPHEMPPLLEVSRLASDRYVQTVAISPDGQRILSGHDDNRTVELWERGSGHPPRLLPGHGIRVFSVAFSPNGRLALTGDQDGIVRMWDTESGELRRVLGKHAGSVFNVAFSPDGKRAYSSGGGDELRDGPDSAIRVWDVGAGVQRCRLEGHTGRVFGLAVAPDGSRVLTGGDTTLILWDARSCKEIRRWQGHSKLIRSVAFLPDSRRAVSSSEDLTIRLWDVDTGKEIRRFGEDRTESYWLAVSPSGRSMLSSHKGKGGLRLWNLATGELVQKLRWDANGGWEEEPRKGVFSRDGSYAVWGGGDKSIRIYRLTESRSTDRPAAVPATAATAIAG